MPFKTKPSIPRSPKNASISVFKPINRTSSYCIYIHLGLWDGTQPAEQRKHAFFAMTCDELRKKERGIEIAVCGVLHVEEEDGGDDRRAEELE